MTRGEMLHRPRYRRGPGRVPARRPHLIAPMAQRDSARRRRKSGAGTGFDRHGGVRKVTVRADSPTTSTIWMPGSTRSTSMRLSSSDTTEAAHSVWIGSHAIGVNCLLNPRRRTPQEAARLSLDAYGEVELLTAEVRLNCSQAMLRYRDFHRWTEGGDPRSTYSRGCSCWAQEVAGEYAAGGVRRDQQPGTDQ